MSDTGAKVASSAASGLVSGLSLATQALATLVLALALVFLFLRDVTNLLAITRWKMR